MTEHVIASGGDGAGSPEGRGMYRTDFTHREWTDFVYQRLDGWIDAMINSTSNDPKDLELSKAMREHLEAVGVTVHKSGDRWSWSLVPDFNAQTYEALADL